MAAFMTFEEIWRQLCRKSPGLDREDTRVEFTSDNLRRLLEQVYEQGQLSQSDKGFIDTFFKN